MISFDQRFVAVVGLLKGEEDSCSGLGSSVHCLHTVHHWGMIGEKEDILAEHFEGDNFAAEEEEGMLAEGKDSFAVVEQKAGCCTALDKEHHLVVHSTAGYLQQGDCLEGTAVILHKRDQEDRPLDTAVDTLGPVEEMDRLGLEGMHFVGLWLHSSSVEEDTFPCP